MQNFNFNNNNNNYVELQQQQQQQQQLKSRQNMITTSSWRIVCVALVVGIGCLVALWSDFRVLTGNTFITININELQHEQQQQQQEQLPMTILLKAMTTGTTKTTTSLSTSIDNHDTDNDVADNDDDNDTVDTVNMYKLNNNNNNNNHGSMLSSSLSDTSETRKQNLLSNSNTDDDYDTPRHTNPDENEDKVEEVMEDEDDDTYNDDNESNNDEVEEVESEVVVPKVPKSSDESRSCTDSNRSSRNTKNQKQKRTVTVSTEQQQEDQEERRKSRSNNMSTSNRPPPPPLNKLIKDNTTGIIGNVSFLLDFAILGHAKCATSFLMEWLHNDPSVGDQIQIWDYEVCDLLEHKPAKLVRKLYNSFYIPSLNEDAPYKDGYYKRGFKCPSLSFSPTKLKQFHDYFPKAVLIIGLRHPVQWFESFYNFRSRKRGYNITVPKLYKDTGEYQCPIDAGDGCTSNAKFHQNLAKFGKTNWKSIDEQKYLNLDMKQYKSIITTIHNPIFLYDVAQLYDTNVQRKEQLQDDIQQFLKLEKPLQTPQQHHVSTRGKYKPMNICNSQYDELRKQLISIGKRSSIWIRKYFIQLSDVTVSNPTYFEQILRTYQYDPCTTNISQLLLQLID